MIQKNKTGFTLIELLLVISIIGLLASVVLISSQNGVAQARDARRIQEVYGVAHALEMYYSEHEEYPDNTDSGDVGCWDNWDAGSVLNGEGDTFISPLVDGGYVSAGLSEKKPSGESNWEKCSYRYQKVENPCGGCTGTYAILYATCETDLCPTNERPVCCSDNYEGGETWDDRDISVFLKQR